MRAGAEILWFCPPCRPDPVAESSRVSGECDVFDQSNYILESEEFNPPRESCDVFGQSNYILESEEFNTFIHTYIHTYILYLSCRSIKKGS